MLTRAATPFVRLRARWRMWSLDNRQSTVVQESELLSLVRRAAATRFGKDHDFASIRSVADFQRRAPLRSYEQFWEEYWKTDFPVLENCTWPGTIPYFALTSGTTTGVTKYIPCSREMLRANSRAARDILFWHLLNRPFSRVLGGKTLMLGGSTDLREEAPGVFSGDLSGIVANDLPWWSRPFVFPPREMALMSDWEQKIDKIARLSLEEDIRATSGTPNWLLAFFDKLAALRGDGEPRLTNCYPDLELVVHGGIDFKPYAKQFNALVEGSAAELREVYPASEAFVAIADRSQGQGLRLIIDNRVFFEFVPIEELNSSAPTRHWLANIEPDIDYAVILTTCAGLWGYILGDTVRFIDIDPPRLIVTGRTSYVLSAFGEHLIGAEIEEAIAVASDAVGASVVDYCVAARIPHDGGANGDHCYVVEFVEGPPEAERLAAFRDVLDEHLCELNEDYKIHRRGDYGLRPPHILAVAPGTFGAWMKSRGKLGGQHKVPRVINDRDLFANLMAFLQNCKPAQ